MEGNFNLVVETSSSRLIYGGLMGENGEKLWNVLACHGMPYDTEKQDF